jgi:hypothetical protein
VEFVVTKAGPRPPYPRRRKGEGAGAAWPLQEGAAGRARHPLRRPCSAPRPPPRAAVPRAGPHLLRDCPDELWHGDADVAQVCNAATRADWTAGRLAAGAGARASEGREAGGRGPAAAASRAPRRPPRRLRGEANTLAPRRRSSPRPAAPEPPKRRATASGADVVAADSAHNVRRDRVQRGDPSRYPAATLRRGGGGRASPASSAPAEAVPRRRGEHACWGRVRKWPPGAGQRAVRRGQAVRLTGRDAGAAAVAVGQLAVHLGGRGRGRRRAWGFAAWKRLEPCLPPALHVGPSSARRHLPNALPAAQPPPGSSGPSPPPPPPRLVAMASSSLAGAAEPAARPRCRLQDPSGPLGPPLQGDGGGGWEMRDWVLSGGWEGRGLPGAARTHVCCLIQAADGGKAEGRRRCTPSRAPRLVLVARVRLERASSPAVRRRCRQPPPSSCASRRRRSLRRRCPRRRRAGGAAALLDLRKAPKDRCDVPRRRIQRRAAAAAGCAVPLPRRRLRAASFRHCRTEAHAGAAASHGAAASQSGWRGRGSGPPKARRKRRRAEPAATPSVRSTRSAGGSRELTRSRGGDGVRHRSCSLRRRPSHRRRSRQLRCCHRRPSLSWRRGRRRPAGSPPGTKDRCHAPRGRRQRCAAAAAGRAVRPLPLSLRSSRAPSRPAAASAAAGAWLQAPQDRDELRRCLSQSRAAPGLQRPAKGGPEPIFAAHERTERPRCRAVALPAPESARPRPAI